jgi:hypothetical protein
MTERCFDKHWKNWLHYFRRKITILLRRASNDRIRLWRWETTFRYDKNHQNLELIFVLKCCRRSRVYWNLCLLSNLHCWFRFYCSIDLCVFEKKRFIRLKIRLTRSNEHFQNRFYQFFRFYFHWLCNWCCYIRDKREFWRLKKKFDDST